MKPKTRRKLAFLAGFAVYFSLLWFFWESVVVYPLKIFVVLLHEWSHAVVLLATGGTLDRIELDPYQGGVTLGQGGNAFLTLSAGYLGSLGWGALIALGARAKKQVRPRFLTAVIGGTIIALVALSVRNPFGVVFGNLFGAALLYASLRAAPIWNRRILLTLGLTSCLYAVLDIKSDILERPELRSDARMLAEVTSVPTLTWGLLWIGVALGVCFLLLRRAYRDA